VFPQCTPRHPLLNALPICAISSLVRDLDLVCTDVAALEAQMRAGSGYVRGSALKPLAVRAATGEPLRVGDLVVFRPRTIGAYDTMEILDGRNVPLEVGAHYVGVLCERRSGKFLNAEFLTPPTLDDGLDLQFVSAAGGIGFATGYSVVFANKHGRGRAGDVEIVGAVIDPATDRPVNTIDALLDPDLARGFVLRTPMILVGGSGADVGKTTTTAALLGALAPRYRSSAVKATGTGRLADSNAHLRGGAAFTVNQTDVGLPSTYLMDELFATGITQMLLHAAFPDTTPPAILRPEHRASDPAPAEVIVVELGGDLGEAGIPVLLDDPALMGACAAVVLCCEGALSIAGALAELRRSPVFAARPVPVYAALPWGNVEGVHARLWPFVERGELAGLVDLEKPVCADEREWRLRYSIHHADILGIDEMVHRLTPALRRLPEETRHVG